VRGGDRTIFIAPAFHAAELFVANGERAAFVLSIGAAKCTASSSVVALCNDVIGRVAGVAAIATEDVAGRPLRTTREEQGETCEREVNRSLHAIGLSRTRARGRMLE